MPQVTQASDTTVATPDAPVPYTATQPAQTDTAPAANAAKTELLTALSKPQPAPKPVTTSAQVSGRSAQQIIDAVSLPATKTAATVQ